MEGVLDRRFWETAATGPAAGRVRVDCGVVEGKGPALDGSAKCFRREQGKRYWISHEDQDREDGESDWRRCAWGLGRRPPPIVGKSRPNSLPRNANIGPRQDHRNPPHNHALRPVEQRPNFLYQDPARLTAHARNVSQL